MPDTQRPGTHRPGTQTRDTQTRDTGRASDGTYVLKSYRYLRLVLVGLVLWLGLSVLVEMQQTGFGCWRTSISSYYWTPVRGVFVGVLVSIGVALIVLRGNTDREDVLLNVAGALAPVVAFVPIRDPHECQSTPWAADSVMGANISNNVGSLLAAGAFATVVAWWVARHPGGEGQRGQRGQHGQRGQGRLGTLSRGDLVGLLVTVGLILVGLALFVWARDVFDRWAHYLAAIPLFLVLLVVMVLNAVSYGRTLAAEQGRATLRRADLANRYLALAVSTVVLVVTLALVTGLAHWRHGTFWLEVVVIAAFAVFWAVQTAELWDEPEGLRPDPEGVMARGGPADR